MDNSRKVGFYVGDVTIEDKKIIFTGNNTTFSAYYDAMNWARDNGYTVGEMERNSPIGIHKDAGYISKWTRMTIVEKRELDGTINSSDFRNGTVTIELK
jgi:hypothetical protein